MKTVIRLLRQDFDNLENQSAAAKTTTCLAAFMDDEKQTAYNKLGQYLAEYPAVKLYQGHDGEMYPKLFTQHEYVR